VRAFGFDQFDTRGSVQELPQPESQAGQVRVRVAASGLNPADLGVIKGFYKEHEGTPLSLVPGLDFAGTVDAVGDGANGRTIGDEVFGGVGKKVWGEKVLDVLDELRARDIRGAHRARRPGVSVGFGWESTKGNSMNRIFSAIGTFSVRFRWPIVIAWVLVTVVSVKALPGLADVAKDAQSSFLPANSPSAQAQQLAQPFQDSKHAWRLCPLPSFISRDRRMGLLDHGGTSAGDYGD
jgi:hypothetical protein